LQEIVSLSQVFDFVKVHDNSQALDFEQLLTEKITSADSQEL